MKAGDLVVRTYGEGDRPHGLILKRAPLSVTHGAGVWMVRWFGLAQKDERIGGKWLEVVSESKCQENVKSGLNSLRSTSCRVTL